MTHAIRTIAAAVLAVAISGAAVVAQTIGLGTTKGGATAQVAAAIAKVVSGAGEVQVRPQAMANTSQYILAVNAGKLDLGVSNFPQYRFAKEGTGMSKAPNPNLMLVANLFPFRVGLMVPKKLGLKTYADLKGLRVPRFPDNSLGDFLIRACLKAGGLTYADVTEVRIANFPRMWDAMKQGKTDIAIAAAGSKPTYDMDAAVDGISFLAFAESDEAAVAEVLPGSFLAKIPANDKLPGLADGTVVVAFDYTLWAHKDVPADTVKAVVEAMHAGAEDLRAASPLWRSFDAAKMAKDFGYPYHPGAIAAYEALGLR